MSCILTVAVDNLAAENFCCEHGLALCLENGAGVSWFDTGAGKALEENAEKLGLPASACDRLILSHGHHDHTGGVPFFPAGTEVFCGEGLDLPCYSCHADKSIHTLTLPEKSRCRLQACKVREITSFTEIAPGMYVSGKIRRRFPSETAGHFFSDAACTILNETPEEIFLYLAEGILITGCCHAGLENCIACLRENLPDAVLHTIIGGMHWLDFTENQLQKTAAFLETLALKRLILLHCTGAVAEKFMRTKFPGIVTIGRAGDRYQL